MPKFSRWTGETPFLGRPSMRVRVKPHSGILSFFCLKRGPSTLTIGHLADASLLALPWHSFSPAALPSPSLRECGGGERMPSFADAPRSEEHTSELQSLRH